MIPLSKKSLKLKKSFVSLILLSLIFCMISCGDNSTNKAKEFMEANMYEQAITLLEQEIQKNPKNATAHMLLGECKLVTGRLSEAENSFKSATILQPEIGMKIGEVAICATNAALRDQRYNQAFQIMALATKYDPRTSTKISEICIDKAKELFGNNMISEGMALLKYSSSQDSSNNIEISNILLGFIATNAKVTKGDNLSGIISWCIQLDQSKSKEIGKIYFDIGSTILENSSQSINDAITEGFSVAVKYDNSFLSPGANKLYTFAKNTSNLSAGIEAAYTAGAYDAKLANDSSELLVDFAQKAYEQGNVETFSKAVTLTKKINPRLFTDASDRVSCIEALYSYQTGNRVQAINELKKLRKSSNDFANKTANKLLSPPSVGKHAVGKSTSWKDLGWTGPMSITLDNFEVTKDNKLILHFVAINRAKGSNKLMFGYQNHESWYPYIVDDNGQKSLPLVNFQGGKQESGNNSGQCRNILFNKDQSIELAITFPITSEGASKFHFVSPHLNGWQWEWSIKNIDLR